MIEAAKQYLQKGISVLPCNEKKACCIASWSPFASHLMPLSDVEKNFANAQMIAIVCGGINQGLEVIDVDLKYSIEPNELWQALLLGIKEVCKHPLVIVKTMNGGYHIYFRCETEARNAKLASRYSTEEELEVSPHQKTKCFIETRANGGYIIAPPSPKYMVQEGNFDNIPVLTNEERDDIISVCRSFNTVEAAPQYTPSEVDVKQNYLLSPLEDYNRRDDVLQVLIDAGWKQAGRRANNMLLTRPGKPNGISASFNVITKLTYIFTSSTEFEPSKAYMPYQILAKIKFANDFKALAVELLSKGYGVPIGAVTIKNYEAIRKVFQTEGEQAARLIATNKGFSDKVTEAVILRAKENDDIKADIVFWYKDDKEKCKIEPIRFRNFLENELNISLYYGQESNGIYRIVTCTDSRLKEITTAELKENILEWLHNNTELVSKTDCGISEIIGSLAAKETLFADGSFEWIRRNTKTLMKDTKTHAYYYFTNGVVVVTKDGIELKDYKAILKDNVIWASQVINRVFTVYNTDEDFNFKLFLWYASGESVEKFTYLCSIIGYCLHRYKDDAFAKAVMLAEEVEDPKQGGGAGKGLLIKALQLVIGGMTVDGESFKPDGNFAFQRYTLGCPFICINDAAKNTQWDKWKSIITDGLTVDVKNKNQLYLPYPDSPKIIATTQYGIDTEKMFLVRRFISFAFEPYFNSNHTPFDEFGEMFFSWTEEEKWMQFYNLMLECVRLYLSQGIKEYKSEGLSKKIFKLKYGRDLEPFLESELRECHLMDLYEEFLETNDIQKSEYKRKTFEDGLRKYIDGKGYKIINDKGAKNKLKIIKE